MDSVYCSAGRYSAKSTDRWDRVLRRWDLPWALEWALPRWAHQVLAHQEWARLHWARKEWGQAPKRELRR
jgi:hypothetical protein